MNLYLKEEELCDALESMFLNDPNCLNLDEELGRFKGFKVYREYVMPNKLRPDFIILKDYKDSKTRRIDIIEVKRFADESSISQVSNYVWTAINNFIAAPRKMDLKPPIIKGHLIARGFDRSLYSVAALAEIKLWRAKVNRNYESELINLTLEEEEHIYKGYKFADNFQLFNSKLIKIRSEGPNKN